MNLTLERPKMPRPSGRKAVLWYTGAGAVLIAVVALVDISSGFELGFFVFYFVPISVISWTGRPWRGFGAALICALIWGYVDYATGHPYSSSFYYFWNAVIRFLAFASFAAMVLKIRWLVDEEFSLNQQLRAALEREVSELRGLLPICASCKRIRDEGGNWREVEVYVRNHSQAEFSHGICPECRTALYPGLEDASVHDEGNTP